MILVLVRLILVRIMFYTSSSYSSHLSYYSNFLLSFSFLFLLLFLLFFLFWFLFLLLFFFVLVLVLVLVLVPVPVVVVVVVVAAVSVVVVVVVGDVVVSSWLYHGCVSSLSLEMLPECDELPPCKSKQLFYL